LKRAIFGGQKPKKTKRSTGAHPEAPTSRPKECAFHTGSSMESRTLARVFRTTKWFRRFLGSWCSYPREKSRPERSLLSTAGAESSGPRASAVRVAPGGGGKHEKVVRGGLTTPDALRPVHVGQRAKRPSEVGFPRAPGANSIKEIERRFRRPRCGNPWTPGPGGT